MPTWTQWTLEVAPDQAEAATFALHEAGCSGVQVDDVAVVLDESEDATFVPRTSASLTGYADLDALALSQSSMRSTLEALLEAAGIRATLECTPLDEADWATQWRENFPPLDIGRFRIVPSWEERAAPSDSGRIEIELDPGLAFGTGQHPTTKMCLELLGEVIGAQENSSASTCSLLDVGCGSGILAIGAAKLGAQVTASDLDEWCVSGTEENAARNCVAVEVALAAGASWTERRFDIVLANLMSEVLIALSHDLRARCHDSSTCIVSGISIQRAEDVARAMQSAGFQVLERREEEGETRGDLTEKWVAFRLAPVAVPA